MTTPRRKMDQAKTTLRIKKSHLTPGQWRFVNSTSRNVVLSGGFGSGKTTALGLKILQLKELNPYAPGLILAHTWQALWSVTMRRFMSMMRRYIPRERIPRLVDKTGECYLSFGDGIPIYVRSTRDPGTYDGLDVGWVVGDELRHWTKESYDVALGRVRVKCLSPQCAFATTPSMNWLYEEFMTGKDSRDLINAPTAENAHNLAPGYIENLRLSYSSRMRRAVLDGEFCVLEGAVFDKVDTELDRPTNPWAIDYDARQFPTRKTILAVGPGYRRSSWLFIHEVSPMNWVVFDEINPENTSTSMSAQLVNARGWPIDEIWCDPAADSTQGVIAIDDIQAIRMIKTRNQSPIRMVMSPFHRSIEYGVEKMRVILGDPESNLPIRLKFATKLKQLERNSIRGIVRDLSAMRYPDVKDGRPITNKPLKDGITDHSTDALRYFCVGMWNTTQLRALDPTSGLMPKFSTRTA